MKKTLIKNYRVVIEPNYSLYLRDEEREEDARRTCESIIEDIKRHVDDVDSVELDYEENEICEFCKEEWEVYDRDFPVDGIQKGLPACCEKAQQEFKTNLKGE